MKKLLSLLFLFPLFIMAEKKDNNSEEVAKTMGHIIQKNLQELSLEVDIEQVIQGMKEAQKGEKAPLNENECIDTLLSIQQKRKEQKAKENLIKANSFLESNEKKKQIHSLEKGKVQYKIEKTGKGESIDTYSNPVIRYEGKYLDGSVFCASGEEEAVNLEEVIPGLAKGIKGMKEGEKRTVYIHPDLGYGLDGYIEPNALLIFQVEMIQSQSANSEEALPGHEKEFNEIATPFEKSSKSYQ